MNVITATITDTPTMPIPVDEVRPSNTLLCFKTSTTKNADTDLYRSRKRNSLQIIQFKQSTCILKTVRKFLFTLTSCFQFVNLQNVPDICATSRVLLRIPAVTYIYKARMIINWKL